MGYKGTNMRSIKPKLYLICLIVSQLTFSLAATADTKGAEKALSQLMSDIRKIKPVNKSKEDTPTHYKTQYGDTLDQIIIDYVPKLPVRTSTLKRVIVHTNPHAFKRSNPNWMFSGKKIKLPDAGDIRDLIFTEDALGKMGLGQDQDSWVRFP